MGIYKKRSTCAICKSKHLNEFISYGEIPLAGHFPLKEELNEIPLFDFGLFFCSRCSLVQTNSIIDAYYLFDDYRYMSSTSLSQYFEEVAEYLQVEFKLDAKSKVVEIGSNDGVLLKPLMDRSINAIGFEPSKNIAKYALDKGCKIINHFFNREMVKRYVEKNSIDLVYAANCFAHIDDLHSIMEGIKYILKEDGHFVLEVHYVKNLINELQYDNAYHEHLYYYSLNSLDKLFQEYSMTIVDCNEISIHSGSIRVVVKNKKDESQKITLMLNYEKNMGMHSFKWFLNYAERVAAHKKSLMKLLLENKKQGKRIVGYGASGRANVLCNFCNISTSIVDYIVDESSERYGRYIPKSNIPIHNKNVLDQDNGVDIILIFAWNYSNMIISKLKNKSYQFIIPFPTPCLLQDTDKIGFNCL